jgi:GcrA cell cycle regulator
MGRRWNGERLAMLRTLWLSGLTAQAIADHLGGVSRSAVMGKIFRLRRESVTVPPAGVGELSPARRRRHSRKDADPYSAQTTKQRTGKSLLELTNDSCRWPHGRPGSMRFFFCGAQGADLDAGIPYCPLHARRAFLGYEGPTASTDETIQVQSGAPAASPSSTSRYVWRGEVRHPAPRWR